MYSYTVPHVLWGAQVSYPVYSYTAVPYYTYAVPCVTCCCHCTCAQSKAPEAAVAPSSGKIQVEGKVELQASSQEVDGPAKATRNKEKDESPLSWRRVSSLPRQRAERSSRDYSDEHSSSSRRQRGRRERRDSPEGRCEGTFVIKGFPRPEPREPRRRATASRGDCVVKGTITLNRE